MRSRRIIEVVLTSFIILTTVFLLCTSASAQAIKTTPKEILANPDKFDGKMVQVMGVASNIFTKVSRSGNPYYTVDLVDSNARVKIFNFGKPNISNGDRAKAVGRFMKENHVGKHVFYNEIDASKGGSVNRI
jgi:hypothetical protein